MSDEIKPKAVIWIASAKNDLIKMPEDIKTDFGFAIYQIQIGSTPDTAKVLKGFGSAKVLELVQRSKDCTYRAIYTIKFPRAVVVLHVFQKKSKKGISTPKQELDLIKTRLKRAEDIYNSWMGKDDE